MNHYNIIEWSRLIAQGHRRALARAITLVESTHPEHQAQARQLMAHITPKSAWRIAITGTPGAGKSTFLEEFGLYLIEKSFRPAILAYDPSSLVGGGAILGDKTRMELLARHPSAFIRPSPATIGSSVHQQGYNAVKLLESAGYNPIFIETIGVGQGEVSARTMCDLFCLILAPAGGDDLQALKRGIMEVCDLILINKADGAFLSAAMRTQADYRIATRLIRPRLSGWQCDILTMSALERRGFDAVLSSMHDYFAHLNGKISMHRAQQEWQIFNQSLQQLLWQNIENDPRYLAARQAFMTNAQEFNHQLWLNQWRDK